MTDTKRILSMMKHPSDHSDDEKPIAINKYKFGTQVCNPDILKKLKDFKRKADLEVNSPNLAPGLGSEKSREVKVGSN